MARVKKKKTDFEISHGVFPIFETLSVTDPTYQTTYAAALNWCSAAFTVEELKGIFLAYLEKGDESTQHFELVPAYRFTSVGKIAYIRMQGNPVTNATVLFYNNKVQELRKLAIRLYEEKKQKDAVQPVTRSPLFDTWMVGERLEDFIDSKVMLNTSVGYDLLVTYRSRQGLLKSLQNRFRTAQDEYRKARSEYAEYFENVKDDDIKYRLRCYARILDDIESVMQNKKLQRKKVQRRASAERKVKKVIYCQSDLDLKIQSADPSSIIGAPMLLLFNKKRRRITVLVAADETGLSVKGTTVQNFDPVRSVSKTLRHPDRQVLEFRRATRARRIDVLMSNINSKAFEASGRLNADTLLLKVVSN